MPATARKYKSTAVPKIESLSAKLAAQDKPVKAAKMPKKTTKPAIAAAPVSVGPKAQAFIDYAQAESWAVEVQVDGDYQRITASSNGEAVTVTMIDNRMAAEEPPTYIVGNRVVKLRNVSAAKKQIGNAVEDRPVKEATQRRHQPVRDDAEVAARLPFDITKSSDQAILDMMAGKKVVWINRTTAEAQEERVPTNSRTLRIDPHNSKTGPENRVVTFIGATGYTSLRLCNIVRISR